MKKNISYKYMVLISKKDGTKRDGTPKKGVNEVKTAKGVRYVTTKENKEKLTKPKNDKKPQKSAKLDTKGVKQSLTEGID